jgi:hypothetical protein
MEKKEDEASLPGTGTDGGEREKVGSICCTWRSRPGCDNETLDCGCGKLMRTFGRILGEFMDPRH